MTSSATDSSSDSVNYNEKSQKKTKQRFGKRAVGGPKFCHVCGEKAKSQNYGGIACHCCRSFFRHTILKKLDASYNCQFKGECIITKETRRKCKCCRFSKCLKIGMEAKWVVTTDTANNKNKGNESDSSKDETEIDLDRINGLQAFYREACENIPYSFPVRKKNMPLTNTMARIVIIGIISTAIRRFVYFAKFLPEFQKLSTADKEALLKQSVIQSIILRGAIAYDIPTNTIFNPNRNGAYFENYPQFSIQEIAHLFPPDLVQMTTQFFTRINAIVEADENSVMLLIPILMFANSDGVPLEDETFVRNAQDFYAEFLRKYVLYKFGVQKGKLVFPKLLSQLVELQQLCELHQGLPLNLNEFQVNKMHQLILELQNKAKSECNGDISPQQATISVKPRSPNANNLSTVTSERGESSTNNMNEISLTNSHNIVQLFQVFANTTTINRGHFSSGPHIGVKKAFLQRLPQLLQNPMDHLIFFDHSE